MKLPDLTQGIHRSDLGPDAPPWVDILLRRFNALSAGLIDLAGGITLGDNLALKPITILVRHGVTTSFSVPTAVSGYTILGSATANGKPKIIQAHAAWASGVPGQVNFKCWFQDTAAVDVRVSLLLTQEGFIGAKEPDTPLLAGNFILLQSTTTGTAQTGHGHISGAFIADTRVVAGTGGPYDTVSQIQAAGSDYGRVLAAHFFGNSRVYLHARYNSGDGDAFLSLFREHASSIGTAIISFGEMSGVSEQTNWRIGLNSGASLDFYIEDTVGGKTWLFKPTTGAIYTGATEAGGALVQSTANVGLAFRGNKSAADAGADIILDSLATRSAGKLVSVRNNTAEKAYFDKDGNLFIGAAAVLVAVTADSPLTGAGTSASHLGIQTASGSQAGALASADWTTFNNKLTTVTADSPLTGAGTSASHLGVQNAGAGAAGVVSTGSQTFDGNKTFTNNVIVSGTLTSSTASAGLLTQEAWTAPSLLNSWVDFGGGLIATAYMKDSMGFVHLRGTIKSGTTTAGTTFFTLPAGYRPSAQHQFPVVSNDVFAEIQVLSNGNVQVTASISATSVSFNGITFDTR